MPLRVLSLLFGKSSEGPASKRSPRHAGSSNETRFNAVSIWPGEVSCEAARQMADIRFLCAKAPRLPLPECGVQNCECRYVHFSDRRSGLDRRNPDHYTRAHEAGMADRRSNHGRRSTDPIC